MKHICYVHWYLSLLLLYFCVSECPNGTYGMNCNETCRTCTNTYCDTLRGNCTEGCVDGFKGDLCKQRKSYVLLERNICSLKYHYTNMFWVYKKKLCVFLNISPNIEYF